MKYTPLKSFFIVGASLFLLACTWTIGPPDFHELDWNPSVISKSGCPDLSGEYFVMHSWGSNFEWLFNKPKNRIYDSYETYIRDKDLPVYINMISRADGLYVRAYNSRRSMDEFFTYDAISIGCSDNMFVQRYISNLGGGAESGRCVSVGYGEMRVSLSAKNDIHMIRSYRERCGRLGALSNYQPIVHKDFGLIELRRVSK